MMKPKVLVTGAASGIGRATAIRFAAEGYDVCLNDLAVDKLPAVLAEMLPGDHISFAGSFADKITIEAGGTLIADKWGRLDALVNCAGLGGKSDPINMDIGEWRVIFDTMVNGCIMISQLAVSFMHEGGRVIHISSIHANRAEQYGSSYSMAKAAINQYCRSMALELAARDILVNAIAPGFVDTAMSIVDGESELEGKWFKDNYIDGHHLPMKRAGRAEEIAGVAFFLAGKDAAYITGQVITVDGGLTVTF